MKQLIKLNESQLRKIVKESVRNILKESLDPQTFEETLFNNFRETLTSLCQEVVKNYSDEKYSPEFFDDYVEEFANTEARELTNDSMKVLNSNNWHIPENNFRRLDFVMGEQGIHNFQELLNTDDPVGIYTDWFWESFGTYGIKYNFGSLLGDIIYNFEQEETDEGELNEGFVNNLTQGAKSFFGNGDAGKKTSGKIRQNGGLNLGKRFNAAKTNYQMTKEGGKINDVIQFLEDMVAKKQLTPQTTIADLIGGSLNNNKYGRLHAMRDNRTSRASRAQNDIYRQ